MALITHSESRTTRTIRLLNKERKQHDDGLTSQLEFFHKVDKICLDYLVDKKIIHKQQ